MYRATDYYDDTLATIAQYLATIDNDKSNCISHSTLIRPLSRLYGRDP